VPDRLTQEQRILNLLHDAWPDWVPATALSQISLQYSARIFSIRRKKGIQIANRTEMKGGVKHGFFRLGNAPIPSNRERRANQPEKGANSIDRPGSLFGDLAPDRSYRE
jgi:hypothetical protein